MKIYGSELRQAALRAVESGSKRRVVATMFGVSVPTLDRWGREHRQSGQVAARPRGHLRRALGPEAQAILEALLHKRADATVDAHLEAFRVQTGQSASRSSLARAIVRLGWTRKKRV